MNRSYTRCALAAAATALHVLMALSIPLPAQHAVPPPPVAGRLAESALLGGRPLASDDLPADLSSADRMRLQAYVDRRRGFEPRSGSDAPHRIRFEQELASIVEATGIEDEAAELGRLLPPADQWGEPEREAAWAETMLRSRPGSPAAPYLYAFLATRYRQVFERMPGEDRAALERQARKYRTMIERTRAAADPVFALLAADLDGLPSLGRAARHPRAYLPDT